MHTCFWLLVLDPLPDPLGPEPLLPLPLPGQEVVVEEQLGVGGPRVGQEGVQLDLRGHLQTARRRGCALQRTSTPPPPPPYCRTRTDQKEKDNSTRCSQAVTHPSTNRAQRCLTSVIRRELVFSTWYGRCQKRGANSRILIRLDIVWKCRGKFSRTGSLKGQQHPVLCSQALRGSTAVIGRELVLSTWHGGCQEEGKPSARFGPA